MVYNAATRDEIARFNAFPPAFKGGVRVATGDVNGDGVADIVVGAGNGLRADSQGRRWHQA